MARLDDLVAPVTDAGRGGAEQLAEGVAWHAVVITASFDFAKRPGR
jgi:hypothetical protein